MIETVTLHKFRDAFNNVRPDNFSYEGLEVLYKHLTEIERDTGEPQELDVIGICCDFVESTLDEALHDTGASSLRLLERETLVLKIPDTDRIIYQGY